MGHKEVKNIKYGSRKKSVQNHSLTSLGMLERWFIRKRVSIAILSYFPILFNFKHNQVYVNPKNVSNQYFILDITSLKIQNTFQRFLDLTTRSIIHNSSQTHHIID